MNLKQEVRAAWVAQEIKRLWPRDGAQRAFKTERAPRAAAQQPAQQPEKEQSSPTTKDRPGPARDGAAQPAQPPGRISPRGD